MRAMSVFGAVIVLALWLTPALAAKESAKGPKIFVSPPEEAFPPSRPETPPPRARAVSPSALFAYELAAAEKGDKLSLVNVGILYEQGVGVARDYTRALGWYEKAVAAGVADGYLRAGACYEVGMGTATDLGKAASYYAVAAGMGMPQARWLLAEMYFQGRGVPRDVSKAGELLEQAASAGHGAAANALAVLLLNGGLGKPKDAARAAEWFNKSAEAGYPEGAKNYAVVLRNGLAGKKDPAAALHWYLVARGRGLRAPDLDAIIGELKKEVGPEKARRAEESAARRLKEFGKPEQ
ncbi:MAG: sel1 repeat family protein [Desulfovibrio sp.]|jgi:TPR repeat protein|nr:sel1 repeat family protein [Desulfovibrio sp.]